jgi:hypothetical protein
MVLLVRDEESKFCGCIRAEPVLLSFFGGICCFSHTNLVSHTYTVYNAPNPGSLQLKGQWWAFGLDFSNEYYMLEEAAKEAAMDAEWEAKRAKLKERALSSFIGDVRSPFMNAQTQALYGLAAQHN